MRIAKGHATLVTVPALVLFGLLLSYCSACAIHSASNSEDSNPPTIDSINISEITESSATITWRTNEEATSQVQFGTTPQILDSESKLDKFTADHSITLKRLDTDTTYYFRIVSKDANGNESASEIDTFVTTHPVGCAIGNRAPDFTLKDVQGKDITLSDLQGKVVVLNFWYTTCPPCTDEWPYWQEAYIRWSSDNSTILFTLHHRGNIGDVKWWLKWHKYTVPTLFDEAGEVANKYCVIGFPQTFFIAADGTIQYIYIGSFKCYKDIQDKVDSLYSTSKMAKVQMYFTDPNTGKPASNVLGTLEFNLEGPQFNYVLDAHKLRPKTEYSLIYYSDPWPSSKAGTLIGGAKTNSNGDVKLNSSIDLGMNLPDAKDTNHPTGADILLVLSEDYDREGKMMRQWHPGEYLWPAWEITYTDTDLP
jgi:peroxiredoxin